MRCRVANRLWKISGGRAELGRPRKGRPAPRQTCDFIDWKRYGLITVFAFRVLVAPVLPSRLCQATFCGVIPPELPQMTVLP